MSQQKVPPEGVNLAEGEALTERARVLTFDLTLFWITIVVLIALYLINIRLWIKLLILPIILWYGSYSVRQPWQLTLTNKRMIARRIYPRPLNYFLTTIKNYPFNHIEGLSVGPKSRPTLFLLGLFFGASIGINLLKLSLSTAGLDLPDTLEFLIFMLKVSVIFQEEGNYLESELDDIYRNAARDLLVFTGSVALIVGILIILISFPWRKYLVARIRYGKDFKLRAGFSSKFIRKLYSQLYNKELVPPPKKYAKWRFPWLKGEKVEGVADLDNILYLNRIIGTFALLDGGGRIWNGVRDLSNFSSTEFILWVLIALIDLSIVVLSIRFSKRRNEMVITNRRIIFAQEVQNLSGYTGKQYFYMSDLRRRDIASFNFTKVHGFAIEYLILGLFVMYFTFSVAIVLGSFYPLIFLLLGVILLLFVNQTFISFELKTKSGDQWRMRHQLANPVTRVRRFVGPENKAFSRILTNRLEESEIINIVQILRSYDTGLPVNEFRKKIKRQISRIEKSDEIEGEQVFNDENFIQPYSERKKVQEDKNTQKMMKLRKRIQLSIDDLLLKNEDIVWEKSIPHPINRRTISLIVGSLVFFLFTPFILFATFRLKIDLSNEVFRILSIDYFRLPWVLLVIGILYALFFLKFYTLRKKSLVVTQNRLFYEEILNPPKFLFFLGIFRETHIVESLLNQLQSIKSRKLLIQRNHLTKVKVYLKQFLIWVISYMVILYFYLLSRSYWKFLRVANQVQDIFTVMLIFAGIKVVWSISNAIIALIQSYPTLELQAEGIGVTFILPYLNVNQAQKVQNIIWSGKSPKVQGREIIERKKMRKKRERGK